jgi:hypothetical protein
MIVNALLTFYVLTAVIILPFSWSNMHPYGRVDRWLVRMIPAGSRRRNFVGWLIRADR